MTVYNSHVTTGDVVIAISYLTLNQVAPKNQNLLSVSKVTRKLLQMVKVAIKLPRTLWLRLAPVHFTLVCTMVSRLIPILVHMQDQSTSDECCAGNPLKKIFSHRGVVTAG